MGASAIPVPRHIYVHVTLLLLLLMPNGILFVTLTLWLLIVLSPFRSFTLAILSQFLPAFPRNGFFLAQNPLISSTRTSSTLHQTKRAVYSTSSHNRNSTYNHHQLLHFCHNFPPGPSRISNIPARSASTATRSAPAFTKAEQHQVFLDNTGISLHIEDYAYGKPTKSLYSVKKQTAAESAWLQEEDDDVFDNASKDAPSRFDWRGRAASRLRKVEQVGGLEEERKTYIKRVRAPMFGSSIGKPLFAAAQRYSEKFLRLLSLEEAEDEAALKHRLSTWSLDRLRNEGYCLTGLNAYWLQANQFGRPVASFVLGPGIQLPENKFENGTQVMISRLDPLKEPPLLGSVLSRTQSHIRVCFPSAFDLDDGVWRLDIGRPNLMYERMRTAISYLETDLEEVEDMEPESSLQYILQGTHLRDVILHSFSSEPSSLTLGESETNDDGVASSEIEDKTFNFSNGGAFKYDQRIHSWARRYSQPNPVVVEGDPPLDGLNQSQIRAMASMIGDRASLIQGPPGTGKTKTIIETVKLLKVHFEVPQPILVCTYTNVAVDNLVEGLAKVGVKPLRVGNNGNVRESLFPHTLDWKLEHHPLHPILAKLVQEESEIGPEIEALWKKSRELEEKIKKSLKPRKNTLARARNMKEALVSLGLRHKAIKRKIYAMQQQMLRDTVADADVICTTCITTACNALNVIDFPVVFIDEASMSTEPASLIPIMKGSRHLALIGDHKQLPPIIVSQQAKEDGFGVSLFERLTEEGRTYCTLFSFRISGSRQTLSYADVPTVMLDVQYRMHPAISHFPSMEFYDLALQDGTVDAIGNALPGLEPPSSMHLRHDEVKNRKPSVIFLDHTGNESFKGRSRINITEAHIVASVVEDLLLNNPLLRGRDIGIIAPYAAQVTLLTRLLNTDVAYCQRFKEVLGDQRAMHFEQIEIKTVDGFEGREKEVIIFSTVRNNSAGHIGFLADKKRLNVGLTRAKRGLFVVGSISTLRAGKATSGGGKVVRVGKGADSWRRYAEYLTSRDLVISLTGQELGGALYGHLDATKAMMKRTGALVVGR
ncbi:hypothetical protein GALMADRAFT_1319277 [Galerina marginata CBS 339.88]|uniref:AAA+ ATPase domain-containing protein n=1 Tax=Galerina marginata (strain CBS 339.88) TaxID=685588 RepID=A0A067THF9_GALM3|nr:hypothetical protein GALMADRAFT_1319277 [Galerina marginata CBS 339.88]